MSDQIRKRLLRYGCSILSIALAACIRHLLNPLLGHQHIFATYYLAVFVTAWYGGLRPALVAVALGGVATELVLPRDLHLFEADGNERAVGLALYIAVSSGIAIIGGLMRTARSRAEAAANEERQQRARLHLTLASIGDGVITADADGKILSMNSVAEALTGCPTHDAAGKNILEVLAVRLAHSEVGDNPAIRALRENKTISLSDRVVLRSRDGSERPVDFSAAPTRHDDGTVSGVVIVIRDTTQRKMLERIQLDLRNQLEVQLQERTEELRASERRLGFLIDSVRDYAIFMLDANGRINSWNVAAQRIYRYSAPEIIGRHFSELCGLGTESDQGAGSNLLVAFAHGRYEVEEQCVREDGSLFWASIIITPVFDDRRAHLGFAVVTRDITERRDMEEALLERERQWHRFIDNAPAAIAMFDNDLRYVAVSRRWVEDFRLQDVRLVGRSHYDVFPEIPERWRQVHQRALHGITERSEEDLFVRADGTHQWLRWEVRPWYSSPDVIGGIIMFTEEITERRATEEALQASQEQFRLLVDGVKDYAIYMLDPNGNVVTWNQGAEKLFGYSAEEIVGRNFSCFFAEREVVEMVPALELRDAAECGKKSNEGWRVRKDGTRFWANSVVSSLEVDGQIRGFSKVTRDMTERRHSEELLRLVLDNAFNVIVGIDERGTVELFNIAGERLFGYAQAEVIGQNVRILMPEPHRSNHDQYIANYLRTGLAKVLGHGSMRMHGRRSDGTVFPIELSITEFRLDDARHFIGIVSDLTERNRLEEQLLQSQKMDAVGQLAGGVAHDFNNILTIISGYGQLMLASIAEDDRSRDFVNGILQAGERASKLTRQLLAFSRRQILEPREISLNEVVLDIYSMLRRLISEDVVINCELLPELRYVKVDPGQIEQVLMNLAVNARDAMPEGGQLNIETSNVEWTEEESRMTIDAAPGRYVMLSVTDTGVGIEPDVLAHIFEPFFTTKDAGKGTGLGLATVFGIIKQSGGHVRVYSEIGLGTSFRIYLPAIEGVPHDTPDNDAFVGDDLQGSEVILLVEDEPAVREVTRSILESFGYSVVEAGDGGQALAVLQERGTAVDIVLTDVVMPGMSGRQLAEQLRAMRPELPVLFMSGYTNDAILRRGMIGNNEMFVHKPFTPIGLARKIRETLNSRRDDFPEADDR
ncbi:MAG: PAS domain S-box protein [Bacteroidetes bacterium]|nr:PAS domain S-box protein [Bacteroidota bacterium]